MKSKTFGAYGVIFGSLGVIASAYGVKSQRWEGSVRSEGMAATLIALAFGAVSVAMIAFGIREFARRNK